MFHVWYHFVVHLSSTKDTLSCSSIRWAVSKLRASDWRRSAKFAGAQPRFQSRGVQFLGLGYCTKQNTDGIPSFVDCSLLRNGNRTHRQKSWGGPSKCWGSGPPDPQWLRPWKFDVLRGGVKNSKVGFNSWPHTKLVCKLCGDSLSDGWDPVSRNLWPKPIKKQVAQL